ncbi:MAG: hypothetical protein QOD77_660 [Thermoplasmata archaeon]|jgi:heme ABC exporter ATP-binding subunit CcmA|nr:hypothetical protein [Thermoplasmata archaeon]
MLRLAGVRKSFDGAEVLRGVDLQLGPGERVALLGPNGAGKSTLLRIAATLSRPAAGTVHVGGVDAAKDPEAARRRLSLLTQDAPLYPELTPAEHLHWWARVQGVPGDDGLLKEAGLAAHLQTPVRDLSRGTRQRLALAMALLPERPLLLLDEPFASLDAQGTAWLEGRFARHRGAILVALHDEAQAARVAHRAVRLQEGRLA